MKEQISISLLEFADFASKKGTAKVKSVIQTMNDSSKDFSYNLGQKLRKYHESNLRVESFEKFNVPIQDNKKIKLYKEAIKGYKNFIKGKTIKSYAPPWQSLKINKLFIAINPELCFNINGETHVIMLYYRTEKLSIHTSSIITALMYHINHFGKYHKNREFDDKTKYSVLDIRRSKLYSCKKEYLELILWLTGEAHSFQSIWEIINSESLKKQKRIK